jgi:hypothetical protein
MRKLFCYSVAKCVEPCIVEKDVLNADLFEQLRTFRCSLIDLVPSPLVCYLGSGMHGTEKCLNTSGGHVHHKHS